MPLAVSTSSLRSMRCSSCKLWLMRSKRSVMRPPRSRHTRMAAENSVKLSILSRSFVERSDSDNGPAVAVLVDDAPQVRWLAVRAFLC